MRWTVLRDAVLAVILVVMAVAPAAPGTHGQGDDEGGLELIGAVLNAGTSSAQYGYISTLSGVTGIFDGAPQNETSALLTFYSDTTTVRVINNGPLRIVNREGTLRVFLDEKRNGDFAVPDSFRDGTLVMTAALRHQVILDTTTNQFTTVFVNTITQSTRFALGGRHIELGKQGQTFRMIVLGRPSASGPGQFVIAGYTIGLDARIR